MTENIDMAMMEPPSPLSDAYRAAEPEDEWLARRRLGWGGSDVAGLLAAYGLAPLSVSLAGYTKESSEHYQRLGVPKALAWKSGLRVRPSGGTGAQDIKDRGKRLEVEILRRYRDTIAGRRIDPKKVRHASSVPQEWFPLKDHYCAALAVTPDAWAKDHSGRLVALEVKGTFKPTSGLKWHHWVQLQAEIATMRASYGAVIEAEQWLDPSAPRGPVRAYYCQRDDAFIAMLRAVCTEAWSAVEALRNLALEADALGKSAADTRRKRELVQAARDTWAASESRVHAVHRSDAREQLEAALGALDNLDAHTDFAA